VNLTTPLAYVVNSKNIVPPTPVIPDGLGSDTIYSLLLVTEFSSLNTKDSPVEGLIFL
jgi:hypothetical protein